MRGKFPELFQLKVQDCKQSEGEVQVQELFQVEAGVPELFRMEVEGWKLFQVEAQIREQFWAHPPCPGIVPGGGAGSRTVLGSPHMSRNYSEWASFCVDYNGMPKID